MKNEKLNKPKNKKNEDSEIKKAESKKGEVNKVSKTAQDNTHGVLKKQKKVVAVAAVEPEKLPEVLPQPSSNSKPPPLPEPVKQLETNQPNLTITVKSSGANSFLITELGTNGNSTYYKQYISSHNPLEEN